MIKLKQKIKLIENKKMNAMNMKDLKREIKNYKKQRKSYLMTTRFNNATLAENRSYLNKKEKMKCIYCSQYQVSPEIPLESHMFVLEMNNETNRITGIGLVRNHHFNYKFSVYENKAYHRYIYVGHYHINRSDMNVQENELMKYFDRTCFRGNRHLKRGRGLTQYPCSQLFEWNSKIDLVGKIKEMFQIRNK